MHALRKVQRDHTCTTGAHDGDDLSGIGPARNAVDDRHIADRILHLAPLELDELFLDLQSGKLWLKVQHQTALLQSRLNG